MSNRPVLAPYSVITNGDMSQASITSSVTVLKQLSAVSYSYSWSGTSPVGTVAVQVSNDYSLNAVGAVSNSGTWVTLQFSLSGTVVSSAPVTGNTGTGGIDLGPIGFNAIRTVYTKTSGTGTLQAVINAKVF